MTSSCLVNLELTLKNSVFGKFAMDQQKRDGPPKSCETPVPNQTPFNILHVFSFLQVNMIKDDGTVIHFNNPKVQASLAANTFAISGHAETKQLTEMLPGIISQLVSIFQWWI